jgi:mannitol/fructose-specific phosphotransferase system IIA component (Ntr-type)
MTIDELLGLFDPELCIFSLKARSRDDVLEEIVELVAADPESTNRRIILEMLRHREALGSTAVRKGIAFPHGRSLAVPRLLAVFARSEPGIDFGAQDGEPTYLFFALLAPPQDQYLPALGKLIELVRDDSMRDKLMQVSSFDELTTVMREGKTS